MPTYVSSGEGAPCPRSIPTRSRRSCWSAGIARASIRSAGADVSPSIGDPSAQEAAAILRSTPVLHVADVSGSAAFCRDRLGFRTGFLHGSPPFYAAVSRDGARLHLKFVHEPVLDTDAARREGLIMAYVDAPGVRELYREYQAAGVEIKQKLTEQAWGGTDFIVRDPDGNGIAFVG